MTSRFPGTYGFGRRRRPSHRTKRMVYHSMFSKFYRRLGPSNCGLCGNTLPKGRRYWCSDRCVQFLYMLGGAWTIIRLRIRDRDKNCRGCGRPCPDNMHDLVPKRALAESKKHTGGLATWNKQVPWVVDHIVPVAEGGPEYDLTNLQLLCPTCNARKTRRDLSRINRGHRRRHAVVGIPPLF